MRQVGIGAALVSSLFSGLNLPVLVNFDLVECDAIDLDTLRATLLSCLESYTRYYTLRINQQKVAMKLRRASSVAELAAALS
jgi:mannose/fructose-specific phosphotransferase system component IIA